MSKRPKYSDLNAARLAVEQRWAYERHLEHLTYRQIRARCIQPEAAGGLGYDLSEHALKGLVNGYLVAMRETLTETREAHIARELADLDAVQRSAAGAMLRAESEGLFDAQATAAYMKAGERRAKLLGLDAPTEAKVDVVHHDAVLKELADIMQATPEKKKARQ